MLWPHVPRYPDRTHFLDRLYRPSQQNIMSVLLTRQTRAEIKESNTAILGRPQVKMKLMINALLQSNDLLAGQFGANNQSQGGSQDPAWEGVGRAGGVKMWRIEQSKLVDWPDRGPHVFRPHDRYGYFYDEDAYIVLYASSFHLSLVLCLSTVLFRRTRKQTLGKHRSFMISTIG